MMLMLGGVHSGEKQMCRNPVRLSGFRWDARCDRVSNAFAITLGRRMPTTETLMKRHVRVHRTPPGGRVVGGGTVRDLRCSGSGVDLHGAHHSDVFVVQDVAVVDGATGVVGEMNVNPGPALRGYKDDVLGDSDRW